MRTKTRILIVEDQFIEANNIRLMLHEAGYATLPLAGSVRQAVEILQHESADLVLLDIFLQGEQSGIDLAMLLRPRGIPYVYLSANADKTTLEKAKVTGPYGFLVKPYRKKDVLIMLDIALYLHRQNTNSIPVPLEPQEDLGTRIIGESQPIKETLKRIRIVGPSEVSALVLGENGTGKELVAESIHALSARKDSPLITVNCAVLPTDLIESELFGHEKGAFTGAHEKRIGKFEQAHGGTIFLDEIGELAPNLQAKFLRVLQTKEIEPLGGKSRKVDVRVIAATNRNLDDEIANGKFRMDLYYRLNVFTLNVPPLRERREDIPLLARHFLKKYCLQETRSIAGFSDTVLREMMEYPWPGNIRELENFVARSVLLAEGPTIETSDLPRTIINTKPAIHSSQVKSIAEQERDHILSALINTRWKLHGKGGAAELLQINASTLRSRMKKLGINRSLSGS